MAQRGDGGVGFLAGVDEVLGQRSDDAASAGEHGPDGVTVLAGVSMTPHAEALITAVTPPDCA